MEIVKQVCCLNGEHCKLFGSSRTRNVKIIYECFILLGIIIYIFSQPIAANAHPQSWGCPQNDSKCVQNRVIEIIFTSIALMHVLLSCSLFIKHQIVKIINQGLWLVKILFIVLLTFCFYLLSSTSFVSFFQLTLYAPIIFFVFQSILFVDLLYALDDKINQILRTRVRLNIIKAIFILLFFLSCIFLIVIFFQQSPLFLSVTNIILLSLFTFITLLRVCPQNSLLICMVLMLFTCVVGLTTGVLSDGVRTGLCIVSEIFLLCGMLCEGSHVIATPRSSLTELLALCTNKEDDNDRYVSSVKWIVYHLSMACVAASTPHLIGGKDAQTHFNLPHYVWWVALPFFYLWSIVASKMQPKKDFTDIDNYFKEFELN